MAMLISPSVGGPTSNGWSVVYTWPCESILSRIEESPYSRPYQGIRGHKYLFYEMVETCI
ncbi:unnamed protein product [Schistosoma curassoni]|nr:unnamed protein product [Schistosoma curassoni]